MTDFHTFWPASCGWVKTFLCNLCVTMKTVNYMCLKWLQVIYRKPWFLLHYYQTRRAYKSNSEQFIPIWGLVWTVALKLNPEECKAIEVRQTSPSLTETSKKTKQKKHRLQIHAANPFDIRYANPQSVEQDTVGEMVTNSFPFNG